MHWKELIIGLCIGYSLGAATVVMLVAVCQRLRESRQIAEMDDLIEMMKDEIETMTIELKGDTDVRD